MRTSRVVLGAAAAFVAAAAAPPPALALQGPKPGAASPQKLKSPDRPGSIHGLSDAASVNVFSGQIGYSVPLDLPKGSAGFGPQLGLTYSGELGDGPMGIGWAIGQIAIRRTTRYGVPSYTSADELELVGVGPGGRLVADPDGKTYWVCGQAKSIRVTKQGARFEVKDAEGTTYVLGSSARARETDGESKISGWLVESATNVVGQQIQFTYGRDQGQTYLEGIDWGPGPVKYHVELEYQGRQDIATSYRTGYEVRTARLLKHVFLKVIDGATTTVAKTFTLGYDESFAASRFVTLQLTGTPRNPAVPAESLPVLTFTYTRPTSAATASIAGVDGWQLNERGVTLLDVDGDGMSDLVRFELGNHQYRRNLGGKFSDPIAMSGAPDVDLETSQLMDLDGDARPELVNIVDDTWRPYSLDKGSWHSLGIWPGSNGLPLHGPAVALADLNGDGRTDVIQGGAGRLTVSFNSKTGFAPPVRLPQISAADAVIEPGNANVRFADFNGDGLADVEYLTDGWMKIFLGRGDGTFVVWQRVFWPWGEAAFDVNDLHIVDLNHDGMMDVVRFSAGRALWYPGMPNGHFADASAVRHLNRPENVEADAVVMTADLLGQGSQNVVWSSPRGLWALDLAGPTTSGMLESIDNGMGKTTRFTYRSSALLSIDAENNGHPWDVKLPIVVPVPIRTEIDLGDDAPLRVVHYGVRDGFWDGLERRFGGFLGASEQHPTTQGVAGLIGSTATVVTSTRFHAGLGDDRVLRGLPWTVQRVDGQGQLIDLMKSDLQAMHITALPLADPCTCRAVKTQDSGDVYEGVHRQTQTLYSEFDDLGRARLEHQLGRLDVGGDERVIRRTFADDPTTWVRDKVCEETVAGWLEGPIAKGTRTYFGAPSGPAQPLCSVGQGLVRQVTSFLDTTGGWPLQSSTSYDSHGNPVVLFAEGVTRTLGYDGFLFPSSETVESSPGNALTWNMTWDHVLGTASTLIDSNLDVATIIPDTLGRTKQLTQNGGDAHTCFSYDWTAPHPKTTTFVFDGPKSSLAAEQPCGMGPHWRQTIAVANGAGEPLYSSMPLGDGRWIVSGWTERDDRGQVSLMAEAFSSGTPTPAAFVAGTRRQTFLYDELSRLSVQTLFNGGTKHVVYAAFHQTVQASELADVESELDGQNRVVFTARAVPLTESVRATYDAADRILGMTLQDGTLHEFHYDTLGRLVSARDPDTGLRTLEYDENNFLKQHHNGENQTVFFDYDGAGRLTRRGETPMADPATDYAFTYDAAAAGFEAGCRVRSRLAGVTEPTGIQVVPPPVSQVKVCYDEFGRQTKLGRTIVAPGRTPIEPGETRSATQAAIFAPSGLLLGEAFDDGFTTEYRYDRAGRATAVLSGGAYLWRADGSDDLDPTGRVQSEAYGNGVTQLYHYDELGLPDSVRVKPAGQALDLFSITVTRNKYGAPTIVHDLDQQGLNHEATYGYDLAARLTSATLGKPDADGGQYSFGFGYDALQNMTFRTVKQKVGSATLIDKDIGVLTGTYVYAERGYGPRQLTSVIP